MDWISSLIDFGSNVYTQYAADERQDDAQQFTQGESEAARYFNASEATKTREYNSAQALAQRDWQERMSNTQIRRGMTDLQAAGLNPLLAVHPGGGASFGQGSHATASPAHVQGGSSGIASAGTGHSMAASMASASQISVNEALAERTKAEADEIRARTPRHEWDIEEIKARIPVHQEQVNHLRQQIGESAIRIEKIWEEVSQVKASAANLSQQTENLKASLPLIKAHVQQLISLSAKQSAETNEIKQRIQENLPQLQRTLGNLDVLAKKMEQPGRANQEAAAESYIGQFGAYLREINPLKGFIK